MMSRCESVSIVLVLSSIIIFSCLQKSHAMVIKPDMEYENNQNSIDPDFPLIDAPKIPSPSRARLLAMLLRGYNDVEDYLTDTRTRERVSKRQRQCFWSVVTCF